MIVFGIDPGSKQSGFVLWDKDQEILLSASIMDNNALLKVCQLCGPSEIMAIEQIRGYGIVAGDDIFDTCEWSGRFREAHESKGGVVIMIPRKDIKRHLCGNTTTNDKYIRQALIDRFGVPGTKRNHGKLYGISGHLWSALAAAITVSDGT